MSDVLACGVEERDDRYRWICECGRRGVWTTEQTAARGGAMHRYRHQQAKREQP